ncbi:hypothetical protein KR018_011786 [Drosophila ironensis]|nr:hypothetical protein KR018_011786 [Drosophila ironensis]
MSGVQETKPAPGSMTCKKQPASPLRIKEKIWARTSGNEVSQYNNFQKLQRAPMEINRRNHCSKIPQYIKSRVAEPAPVKPHEKSDEDDWYFPMLYKRGDRLDRKIYQELKPEMDFSIFSHVLEISHFPSRFKTPDVHKLFNKYKDSGFDIKFVDATHALVVFSSFHIAAAVLRSGHPIVKVKPLAEATLESQWMVKNAERSFMLPYRRRLVSGALDVKPTAEQERESELRVLREAKERKMLAAKQQDKDRMRMFYMGGDRLDRKIHQKLNESVARCKIEEPKIDFSIFSHVLEVSNIPSGLKTPDLVKLLNKYKDSGFGIKFVDATHALVVFSCSHIAAAVLSSGHPVLKAKPLAEATLESRWMAKNAERSFMLPYRRRPETCVAIARRMVAGALGVKLPMAQQERENELRVLRAAKERKMLAAKHPEKDRMRNACQACSIPQSTA